MVIAPTVVLDGEAALMIGVLSCVEARVEVREVGDVALT